MTRTDTITATDAAAHGSQTRALRDGELDLVSGGDLYMHNPRGSNNRHSESSPDLGSVLISVLRALL